MKYYSQINFGIDQIETLDKIFGGSHQELLFKIENDSFFSAYGIAKDLITRYSIWIANRKEEIEKKKDRLKKTIGKDKLTEMDIPDNIKNLQNDIYLVKSFLNNIREIINYRKTITVSKGKKEAKEELLLTPRQTTIYNHMLSGSVKGYKYEDFYQAYKYYIRVSSYKELKKNGLDNLKIFIEYAMNIKTRRAYEDILLLKSQIEKRISLVNKMLADFEDENAKKEIKLLKSYLKLLDEVLLKIDNHEQENHNYLFDIIDFWLQDENNEYYLLELFKRNPRMVNLKENATLAEIVIDKFCLACKMYLINHGGDVNKEYYLKVFNRIITDPNYNHEHDDLIEDRINTLKEFIQKGNFKADRKREIYELITKLGTQEESLKPLKDVNREELNEQMKYIKDYLVSAIHDSDRMNLTRENVLVISNGSYQTVSYSVEYSKEGSTLVKVHILDVAALIPEGTPLELYMINTNHLSDELCRELRFEVGKFSPAMTYQFNMRADGFIDDFKVYKSVVKPEVMVNYDESYNVIKKDEIFKPFIQASKKISEFYHLESDERVGSVISDSFDNILTSNIARNVLEKDLPFIFKVQNAPDQEEYVRQLTELNWFLFRVSNEDFRNIYQVVSDRNNTRSHYDVKDSGHFALDSHYVSDLTKPFNYTGLILQRIMTDAYIKDVSHADLVKYYDEVIIELINYYNELCCGYKRKIEIPKRTKQKSFTKK